MGVIASLIIGIVAAVIVGGIGTAVSIRVSNNAQTVQVDCCLNKSNHSKSITINADKGKLYYALENDTKTKNTYKVYYKTSSSASYRLLFIGDISSRNMIGYKYMCSASGWSKRYTKITQINNLSSTTSHCNFYTEVRK